MNIFLNLIFSLGDNILTAISVARQCGIVKQELPVYHGDIGEKKINGKLAIVWKDFELADQILNPNTLQPADEKEEEKNNQNNENFEIKKKANGTIKRFEIATSIKKSKLYYFSFGEKHPKYPTPPNFRQMPSAFKNKYILSDIGKIFSLCHKFLINISPCNHHK